MHKYIGYQKSKVSWPIYNSQVFITSEEAEQGVNPMDINKGMRSYRFPFHPFVQTKDGD